MIETLFPKAMAYLSDLLFKNEEVQKFPKDFVSASMRWVRSWFLEDDPVTKSVVESNKSVATKEAVVAEKLQELLQNPTFVQELQAQLAARDSHQVTRRNVVEDSEVEVVGNVHIGDKGQSASPTADEENIVSKSKIKAGKDFWLGDDSRG